MRALPLRRLGLSRGELARRAPTSPLVIFGALSRADSSFSSPTQLEATRLDSSACAAVSKKPMEVMTPLPASMR